jgi:flagellar biosynthesis/type III secretory pathway M-ring protein FliF/YscJ
MGPVAVAPEVKGSDRFMCLL